MNSLSCAELVRLVLKGTYSAFGVLYKRYDDFVRKTCFRVVKNRETADDLMQEAFQMLQENFISLRQSPAKKTLGSGYGQ